MADAGNPRAVKVRTSRADFSDSDFDATVPDWVSQLLVREFEIWRPSRFQPNLPTPNHGVSCTKFPAPSLDRGMHAGVAMFPRQGFRPKLLHPCLLRARPTDRQTGARALCRQPL